MNKAVAVVAGVLVLVTMAACTATGTPAPSPSPSGASSSPSEPAPSRSTSIPDNSPTPNATAVAVPPVGETLLGKLDSQRGTNKLGPYTVTSDKVAVYVVCVGSGPLEVTLAGIGSFPLQCGADTAGPGIRNTFDARFVKEVSVQVQGDNSLLWGISVTAVSN